MTLNNYSRHKSAAVESAILFEFEGLSAKAQLAFGCRADNHVSAIEELIRAGRQLIPRKKRGVNGLRDPFTRDERSALLALMTHARGHVPLTWIAEFCGVGVDVVENLYSSYGVSREQWKLSLAEYESVLKPVPSKSSMKFKDLSLLWYSQEIDGFPVERIQRAYFPNMTTSELDYHLALPRGWRYLDNSSESRRIRLPRVFRRGIIEFERAYGGDLSLDQTSRFFGIPKSTLTAIRKEAGVGEKERRAHHLELAERRRGTFSFPGCALPPEDVGLIQIWLNVRCWPVESVLEKKLFTRKQIELACSFNVSREVRKLRRSHAGSNALFEDERWLCQQMLLKYHEYIKRSDLQQLLELSSSSVYSRRRALVLPSSGGYNPHKRDDDARHVQVPDSSLDWADRLYILLISRMYGREESLRKLARDPDFEILTAEQYDEVLKRPTPFPWLHDGSAPPRRGTLQQLAILRQMLSRHYRKERLKRFTWALGKKGDTLSALVREAKVRDGILPPR
jgi:hypothetical protein